MFRQECEKESFNGNLFDHKIYVLHNRDLIVSKFEAMFCYLMGFFLFLKMCNGLLCVTQFRGIVYSMNDERKTKGIVSK